MVELNDNNFKSEIINKKLVLVDFYATWCGPCGMQAQVLDRLENSRGLECDIVKVNVDESPNVSSEFGIDSIPTLMLFKDGKLVKKVVGVTSEEEICKMVEIYID